MKAWHRFTGGLLASGAWLLLAQTALCALPVMNEILLKPPSPYSSKTAQYLEIRGTPNSTLTNTYVISVEGDLAGSPGVIQDVFDLSGRRIGGNGFLVLLQKSNTFSIVSGATTLTQAGSGDGFGSGNSSSIGHKGENGQTDLEGPSVTFFLIQTTNKPTVGLDIDPHKAGVPDAAFFADWTILDSIGILDNSGAGDIAYGAINFRRNAAALAPSNSTIVPIGFTPDYIGRAANSTGSTAADWVAGGNLTAWTLGDSTQTQPPSYAGRGLNHVGGPNFGAAPIPGVLITPAQTNLLATEAGAPVAYTLALNTTPSAPLTLSLTAEEPLRLSLQNTQSFAASALWVLTDTNPITVYVQALANHLFVGGQRQAAIRHAITTSGDPVNYPSTTQIPDLPVTVLENKLVLLNELKVNPPGEDAPMEFVELTGTPGTILSNLYFTVIAGTPKENPGTVLVSLDLTGARIGDDGLLLLGPTNSPYWMMLPPATGYFFSPRFSQTGGLLENDAATFCLIGSPTPILEGGDWDSGDNGRWEGFPAGAILVDSVAFLDANTNHLAYSAAILQLPDGSLADAASRFPGNLLANTSSAWFFAQLATTNSGSLEYNPLLASPGFPSGAMLTPGALNATAIAISPIRPITGTIGDPANYPATFTATASTTNGAVVLTASSDNWLVISNTELSLVQTLPGLWTLSLHPHGVGYATITVHAADGRTQAQLSFSYAASEMGRPGGIFLSGASDASAAMPLDSDWMLVGDDENQVLRLYSRHASGPPAYQTNMSGYLGLTDFYDTGIPKEVDIEGTTRVGNRIFWMGSHSHGSDFEGLTNRSRMFATDVSGTGTNITLAYVGRYDYLKLDLVNWDVSNGHGRGSNYYGLAASTANGINPKTPWGFNIEGLAMAPGSTNTAYLGLRAPIGPAAGRDYALIIPITNFAALAASTGPPGSAQFGVPIELDLLGRGIRSIEGSTNGYLIVGGQSWNTPGDYPNNFKLYTWSGQPGDPPLERDTDLSGMNPEGLVGVPPGPWSSNTLVQLISDNGLMEYYGDGIPAKFLPIREFRKFRCDTVLLGNPVTPAPLLQQITWSNQLATLRWRGVSNTTYQVQYKASLADTNWIPLPGSVTATGPWSSKTDLTSSGQQRFYRIACP